MIQRVVRNGRVRAFGDEWELDAGRDGILAPNGPRLDFRTYGGGVAYVEWYEPRLGVRCIGRATRRPMVDLMANLREILSNA